MSENLVSSPFHFFSCNEFLVCLVCQEAISREPNQLCSDVNNILSSHINAKTHQDSVKALFKLCIPYWKSKNSAIVQNLVFDITIEKEKSSYIYEVNNHLFCSVCEESIVRLSETKDIKITSLINHVRSVSHLNKLKNVSWVFCFDDKMSFVMFFESVAYCSICKDNIQGSRVCPVRRAVKHLKDFHPKSVDEQNTNETPTTNRNTDSPSEESDLCYSFLNLSVNEEHLLGTDNLVRNTSLDFSLETCSKFETILDPDIGCDTTESFRNLVDSHRDSCTCPECGKSIIIYNENLDFSLDLHKQTHKTLSSINHSSCLNYQEDADFVCPICQETVQVFNKNLEFSYNIHFENNHTQDSLTSADVETKNKFDFLSRVFETLPVHMREQRGIFMMDGNEVVCKLCNCVVSSTKRVPEAGKVFYEHISNSFHIDQYNVSTELMEAKSVKISSHKETSEQSSSLGSFFTKSFIIFQNREFIEKQKINYFCTLCQKHICYSPKEDIQIFNFHSHLNSELHNKYFKELEKQRIQAITEPILNKLKQMNINSSLGSTNNVGKKTPLANSREKKHVFESILKRSPVIEANKDFIRKLGHRYVCSICKVQISYSPQEDTQILNFVSHFNSKLHKETIKTTELVNAVKKISSSSSLGSTKNVGNETPQTNPKDITNKFENMCKKSAVIEVNKDFIRKLGERYICTICEVQISYSPQEDNQVFNFMSHLEGYYHKTSVRMVKKQEKTTKSQVNTNPKSNVDGSMQSGSKALDFKSMSQNELKIQKVENVMTDKTIFENNKKFVEKKDKTFFCTLCKKHISYSPKEASQVFNLVLHFKGYSHMMKNK